MAPVLLSFDELNKYEEVRQPHAVSEEISVEVHPDSVRSEFTCIICLDILTKTMTSRHCMHRFCYDCITTSLRLGNKECPTCRAKLMSKRDLRPDLVFDSLIATLFSQDIQSPADRGSSKLTDSILGLNLTPRPNRSNEKNQQTTETEKEPKSTNKKGHEAINISNDEDYKNKSNNAKNSQNGETRTPPLRKSLRRKDSHIKQESKECKPNDHKRLKNKNRNTKPKTRR